ncbi:DNA gyrase subunit A [Aminithiophilus ramosus]|uniref:DNA gyrase subunit A n=2 Tax=Synergistales TaxID=649776 RepID=A0A9Q7EXR5_9BACT|nr:DNA gyrase subunit A [Aminithiophilus ramosus]QTX32755.1 DNA gyrase subunit A [Aminithiophilus ramosus]QVL36632.1 DNA gyrase subunit A [Synergistota bacterium]
MTKDSERLDFGTVLPLSLEEEIKHSYLDYAMSVIVGRALPDAKDGLKPVQRRILYAMLELGLRHNQAYKKSARVVGETMGKYHPHGDAAIYDTMARMAQDFSMRYPLVDGQGNFGSIDGDPPAAMRYTEARLTSTGEEMLTDIDEETVDWGPNFDESLKEPRVLPSLIPNLLVNGSSGIAVGMATNIPPHNLSEVVDALCLVLDNDETELGEILSVLPGPDFPTGGVILGRDGIVDAYRTGRGRVVVRGKAEVESGKRGKGRILITEIPYMVNKTNLIETIAKCAQNKTINGVTDIRDESDRKGLRIVLEVSRDADPEVTLRQLYSRTQLQSTFGVINLALVNNEPRVLPVREMLRIFLDHRRSVVRRRTEYRLRRAQERAHIVEGLVKALDLIDRVIALIRGASDPNAARAGLVEELAFSEAQAQAILDMRLQRLTGLERRKLEEELAGLLAEIERFRAILGNEALLDGVVKEELLELKKRFGDGRRTRIADDVDETLAEDLIPESEIVVVLSRDNFLRRMQLQDYRCQLKGGKGVKGAQPKGEDEISLLSVTTTHRDLFLFTTRGRVFAIKGYVVPEPKTGKGKHVGTFIPLEEGERVVALRDSHLDGAKFVFFLTVQGIAKRIEVGELSNLTRAGRRILGLAEGDEIARVHLTSGGDELILTTAQGQALRVAEDEFRPLGRQARGVRAIRLGESDCVVGCDVVRQDQQMLCISQFGLGKKTAYDQFALHHRGGSGVKVMNLGDRTGPLVGSWGVRDGDELLVISGRGRVIRFSVDDIPSLSRIARGSILVRLDDDDAVADVSVFRCDPEED